MKGRTASGIILALLLTGMVTLASNAGAQPLETQSSTWIVDDDGPAHFSSIQKAINAASPGDTIYVKAGTYREPQVTIKKPLQLIGENKNTTIVDGGGTWVGLYVQNTRCVTISGFTVQNSWGLYSWGSQRVTISENIIFDNGHGIVIGESTHITVSKNIVTQNGAISILLDGSSNSKIYENIFTLNSGDTIWLSHSPNNSIYGNKIKSNGQGIRLDWSSNNSIYGNDITNNRVGIYYWASSNNSIYGNKIEDNVSGIVLQGYSGNLSSSNTFYRNNVTNNEIGVNVEDSSNNIFYHNNFKDNTQQVIIETSGYSNSWDDGYEGNYWSDYGERYPDAEELDGSGIWDTPYVIDENNQDNYPLMPPLPRTVDELKTEIEKCWSEGEIDNQGIVNSLLAKLNVAQKLADKGKTDEARSILEDDFIPQVQNLSGIHVTVEAADVLVKSAEYILSSL
jgi:parallel beta-helix repeat protein